MSNKVFTAVQLHKSIDIDIEVFGFNGCMAVCAASIEGPVLITKEQAMKFFNLTEHDQNQKNGEES